MRYAMLLPLALLLLLLPGCQSTSPIVIGFAAEITGRRSELGVDGRDGAQLAVNHINAQGGVAGRPLRLLVYDDQSDPNTARQVDRMIMEQGAVALIGHMTSEMTKAVLEQNNQAGLLTISPTASSSEFSGLDDYFLRVLPDTASMGRALADYIYTHSAVDRVLLVYDLSNLSYTQSLSEAFQRQFSHLGGDADQSISFTSNESDLKGIAFAIRAAQPQAVVLLTSAFDGALLLQYVRPALPNTRFFGASWSVTNELIAKGGRHVDGVELISVYDPNYASASYQAFLQAYQQQYSRRPSLAASHAYETVLVLAEALQQTDGQAQGLKTAVLEIQNFPGLQGEISFDPYGDVSRPLFMTRVIDGQFVVVATLSPPQP
jgi:branched-chain amino acid transport system substrate-binding protein